MRPYCYYQDLLPGQRAEIFFAFSCNLTCKYCYQRAPQKNGVMSISNFHRFTNWISNELFTGQYSQCSIEIYGGEPLLAKRLIKILFDELALTLKKTNIPIDYDIVTNGTLLDDEIIKLFIINDVYMQITIDGDRETHNQRRAYRNGKGSYDKIISNISSIIKQGGNDLLKVRMNVDTKNFTQISNVASKLHSINVKNFELGWVNFLSPISPDYSHSINSSDFENLMIEIYNVLKPFGYAPTIDNFSVITTCMFHRFHGFTITPELDVFKCDELMDFKKYKLGFIDENSLLVIDKVRYDQFLSRKPSNFHECVNCRLLPVCGCGCAVQALRSKGELHQNYCETTYKKIETRIKNFILVSEI